MRIWSLRRAPAMNKRKKNSDGPEQRPSSRLYSFIGHRLAQSMLRPHVATFLDVASAFRQSSDLDLEIEQLQIGRASPLVSNTLEQLRLAKNYGVIVLAVQHKTGVMQFNLPADTSIEAGEVLMAMGERPKLRLLEEEIGRSA